MHQYKPSKHVFLLGLKPDLVITIIAVIKLKYTYQTLYTCCPNLLYVLIMMLSCGVTVVSIAFVDDDSGGRGNFVFMITCVVSLFC